MPLLTVFTPTYNRTDLLSRGYQALCRQSSHNFVWLIIDDGSRDGTRNLVSSWVREDRLFVSDNEFIGFSNDVPWLKIHYCWKENGGLHTGYNMAIELMDTEICVCIDSDDYMPDDAVENIVNFWNKHRSKDIAGFIGLDYYVGKEEPIGGYLQEVIEPVHLIEIETKLHHYGDTKMVIRADLFKQVAPQPTFPGEKNFNPIYMIKLINKDYPFLTINKNLCFVDYQEGGMTFNIFRQYVNSPRSFAALRLVSMRQPKLPYKRFIVEHLHYVADKFLAKEPCTVWSESASKLWVTLLFVPGWMLSEYIKYKARK